ncbi:MAG: TlpA disulfide reductase family protein [Rickettsiales bacterium]
MHIKSFCGFVGMLSMQCLIPPLALAQENIKLSPVALPDITVKADGKEFSIKQLISDAKVTILHFWATWCPSCADEMPNLAKFSRELEKAGGEVASFALENASTEKIRGYLKKYGADDMTPYTVDRSEAMKTFGLRGIPTTLIVGKDGKLYEKWEGDRDWTQDGLAEKVLEAVKSGE